MSIKRKSNWNSTSCFLKPKQKMKRQEMFVLNVFIFCWFLFLLNSSLLYMFFFLFLLKCLLPSVIRLSPTFFPHIYSSFPWPIPHFLLLFIISFSSLNFIFIGIVLAERIYMLYYLALSLCDYLFRTLSMCLNNSKLLFSCQS